jgi:cobalt-precorrin 5A hydrolase
MGEALMVAGIGCRAGVSGEQVLAAIAAAMETLRATHAAQCPTLTAVATPASKAIEPGIRAAATACVVPLLAIAQSDLEAANAATVTRSARSMAAMNVHSVAEAAAVAGAIAMAESMYATHAAAKPEGTRADAAATPRLLLPRISVGPVTCALASLTP